jgi:CelD/BcsL family acetyltransferase involved in cellulose biosynthesis
MTPEWNRIWWEEFGRRKRLYVLTFLDPGPVGLAALMIDSVKEGERMRFLGGDDLTDYLGPLSAGDEYLPGIADALIECICNDVPYWEFFDAKAMPVPFGFAEWLVEAADRRGLPFTVELQETTSVLPLEPSFDEYLESLPQKKRHELKRKLRRFDDAVPGSVIRTSDEGSLESDLPAFFGLHLNSEGVKGKFFGPNRAAFFAKAARTFQPMGMLSLDFLEAGGRKVAATFSFPYEETFYLYNSAYDLDFKNVSAGLILKARLIERSGERGLRYFDFLRGGERYKADLGAQPLPMHAVRLEPPPRTT